MIEIRNVCRRLARFLGVIVALAGCAVIVVKFNSTSWEIAGLIICIIGASVVRTFSASGKLHRNDQRYVSDSNVRPGRLAWALGVISAVAVILSFAALYVDAKLGSHWQWPLYAIGVSAVGCAWSWSYLAAKMGWFV